MAIGSELIFVLGEDVLTRLVPAEDRATTTWDDGSAMTEDQRRGWLIDVADDAVAADLRRTHLRLLRERFDPAAAEVDRGTLVARTPAGPRRFTPFHLAGFGVEAAPHRVLGISIWGRYQPVWADWRHEYGGSGDDVVLDIDTTQLADRARVALAAVVPEVAAAPLAVVQRFY